MNKIAMITGATSGIGKACAKKFAASGYNLILTGRREQYLENIKKELTDKYPITVYISSFDIGNAPAVKNMIQQLSDEWKQIDVLINNAGTPEGAGSFQESDEQGIDVMVDTNIKGLMHTTRQILPLMLKRNSGYIFNVGSIGSHLVSKGGSVYCATKFAVLAFSQGLRNDLLGMDVRVTTISPGFVDTEFVKVLTKNKQDKIDAFYAGTCPLLPEDIADAIFYCVNTPLRVNIDEMVILPKNQAGLELYRSGK